MIRAMQLDGSFDSQSRNQDVEVINLKHELFCAEEKLKFLDSENNWLREQIKELKRARFGRKSEKWESSEQLKFNEVEAEALNPEASSSTVHDSESEETEVRGHKRKRGSRKPLPEGLPRDIVKVVLPPEELFAEDGSPLKIIGWEKSEKLKYEPSKLSVVEIHRAKYGVDSGDFVRSAPPIPAVIPKGIATSELLAAIVVMKYTDGLPLYRIEEILKRSGVELTRGTMARWMIQVAEALQPIRNVLADRWHNSFYVGVDETSTQVLKENGKTAESKSWMWVRATPYGDKKVILFDYSATRSGTVAEGFFADFRGTIQCDGLNCYDILEKDGVDRIGCNMHARRRFESAVVNGAKNGQSLGEQGLEFYQQLYEIEENLRGKPPDERYRVRLELAQPIWDKMKTWATKNKPKVPVKSKIGNAFQYFENEYEYLTGYLKDGRFEMDNGFTERAIRKFAIGRNNWIFSDTVAGAEASSTLYSLTVTARVNQVEPYQALVKMIDQIPLAKTIEDYESLADLILSPK